jgi:hypothetical protein
MDSHDFHSEGGQAWRYNDRGIFLQSDPNTPLRTRGEPTTITAILAAYGTEIFEASMAHQVPPELIVMTIATETAIFRKVNFTGPRTFRWEQSQGSYSGGPMQVLETTARGIINQLQLNFAPRDIPPHFPAKPQVAPSDNPLYDGDVNIPVGTGYIRQHRNSTGLNPILVSACYNAGSVRRTAPTQVNPWGLVTHGDHLNRAAAWFGDACAVLSEMRRGQALNADELISAPADVDPDDNARDGLELSGLTREEADEQAEDFRDSGATVFEAPEEGGFFTLVVTYSQPVATPGTPIPPPPPPPPAGPLAVQPPQQDGYVICIDRRSTQLRAGKNFRRTVGVYQVFFNRQPVAMHGTAVERQGPGDNTNTGVQRHSRLVQGTYPLFTHAGAKNKYRTFGFANPGGLQSRPWPSIRIGNTGARSGVLIHCAAGYLMSIGCINLTGRALQRGVDDIEFFDSRQRVVGLIQSMKAHLGNQFPSSNNVRIPNAALILRGEP